MLMAKKGFTNSFNDIFSPTVENSKNEVNDSLESKAEVSSNDIQRTTLLLSRETYDTVRAIAWYNRKPIKDYLEEALKSIINSFTQEELSQIRNQFSQRQGSR